MTTTWIKELISATIGAMVGDTLRDVLKTFGQKAAETTGKRAGEWATFQIFGVSTEDERRYNKARHAMDLKDRTRLNKKLAQPEVNDNYFRICVMDDDIAVITRNLIMYAQMSDADWDREKQIMNLVITTADSHLDRLAQLCGWPDAQAMIASGMTAITDCATAIRNGAVAVGGAIKTGAVATGKAVAAKYKDTGDNWQATGVNDALGDLNSKLLARIKKNLS